MAFERTFRPVRTAARTLLPAAVVCLCAAAEPPAPATAPAETRPATRRAESGPSMPNIFYPKGSIGAPAPTPGEAEPAETREFRVIGTAISDEKAGALIEYADTGETAWLRPGGWIAGLRVRDITPQGPVFERDGEAIPLAVGQSSRALLAGGPVLAGSFELLGVRTGPEAFALIRVGESDTPRRVQADDKLGQAVVVRVDDEGMTLRAGDEEVEVPVGGAYTIETTMQ